MNNQSHKIEKILKYFGENQESAKIINEVIFKNPNLSRKINTLIQNNLKAMNAITRAINSSPKAKREIDLIVASEDVQSLVQKIIENTASAKNAIENAINQDEYARVCIAEAIQDADEDTLLEIDNEIAKSSEAVEIISNLEM